jgi:hypothetical protein
MEPEKGVTMKHPGFKPEMCVPAPLPLRCLCKILYECPLLARQFLAI